MKKPSWPFFIILIFCFCTSKAEAMQALSGEVISLDSEKGEMVVRLKKKSWKFYQNRYLDGRFFPSRKIKVFFPPDRLPSRIKKGRSVRIWGEFDIRRPGIFNARHIRGPRMRLGHDPTGVRSRLGRFHRMPGGGLRSHDDDNDGFGFGDGCGGPGRRGAGGHGRGGGPGGGGDHGGGGGGGGHR